MLCLEPHFDFSTAQVEATVWVMEISPSLSGNSELILDIHFSVSGDFQRYSQHQTDTTNVLLQMLGSLTDKMSHK